MQAEFMELIEKVGGEIKFDRPIRFAQTPHAIIQYIPELNNKMEVNEFGNAKHTILQRLRWIVKNNNN